MFRAHDNKVVEVGNKINKTIVNLSNQSKNNKSRNSTDIPYIKAIKKPNFLISNTKKTFNQLKKTLIKALIL